MEKESFEDTVLAQVLNDGFVSIKVDKEERPDIDSIYMDACQMMTSSGGWPLSIFLDHEGNCFYAGTYFPKQHFMQLLELVTQAFKNNRSQLISQAKEITKYINRQSEINEQVTQDQIYPMVYKALHQNFDTAHGGFGFAPKFPSAHNLLFLMDYYIVTKDTAALTMAEKTLNSIYNGGIHDHIGGGYHRYSTDERWLAPHFEKMLYDNALLALAYTKCYEITQQSEYRSAAFQILDYILRDMTDTQGGFYSAEDADSEGEEGLFYVWTKSEISSLLGEDDVEQFCQAYDISAQGNFEGKNIPNLIGKKRPALDDALEKLFQEREKRIHPFKDEKILTGWNGLMIAAFAACGRITEQEKYVLAAEKAYTFIQTNLKDNNGNLLSVYKDGIVKNYAHLEDIAFLAWGAMELHKSTLNTGYLIQSMDLCDDAITNFYDQTSGGFYLTSSNHEKLIAKSKPLYDGAYPSPNSVLMMVLKRLFFLTGKANYETVIGHSQKGFQSKAKMSPSAFTNYCLSELFDETAPKKIVLIGEGPSLAEMIRFFHAKIKYNDEMVAINFADNSSKAEKLFSAYPMKDGKATAYICVNQTCLPPITDLSACKDFSEL